MIIISKIKIEYFRSLKSVSIQNLNHLNVFSGKNDIGKSNVLKALDTFFNKNKLQFIDDFNKERLTEVKRDSIKGKQFIKITIDFNNTGTYKTLPSIFSISKSWDRDGNIIEGFKDNFDTLVNKGKMTIEGQKIARTSLTKFLNKIRFTYVPAIRDELFFSYLLNKLQETIFEVEERKRNQTFQKRISDFNDTVTELTSALNLEFQTVSGIQSSLSFPNNVAEIFQRLIIDTKSGEHNIPLRLRGDGIRLRYIPTILNYISNNSKYYEIWGFDEPENSCEYSLSKKISEQFSNEYSKKSQIFVASHSFHFISIENVNTSKYRVYRKEGSENTEVAQIDVGNQNILSDELGIIGINKELAKLYESLSKEMVTITETKEKLKNIEKPYLIFEGKTDNVLFSLAFEALYNRTIDNDFILCEHLTSDNGGSIGSGAHFINQFMCNHISKTPTKNKVIGIFDFDSTGVSEIVALKNYFDKLDSNSEMFLLYRHKIKRNVFVMTLVTPNHRIKFIHKTQKDYCFLSTELLFLDDDIPSNNRKYPTLFDDSVYTFSGTRVNFALSIETNKATTNFVGFKPTFEIIDRIITTGC
jgi:AAA15 family ATPase/GTPase